MASTKAFSNMVAALTIFALQIGRRQLSANEARVLAKGLQEVPDRSSAIWPTLVPLTMRWPWS